MTNEMIKILRQRVRSIERTNFEQVARLLDLEEKLDALAEDVQVLKEHFCPADPDDPFGEPDEIPDSVEDKSTLVKFVKVMFPENYDVWLTSSGVRQMAGEIRDSLVETYENIDLHPDWTDTGTRHLDAFYLVNEELIVDFVHASSDPGYMSDKLQWLTTSS